MTPIPRPPRWRGLVHGALWPARLLERTRGRRRLALLLLFLSLAGIPLVLAWRASRLVGLPDVGDPFDTVAFRSFQPAEEDNAFTYFHRARERSERSETIERRVLKNPWTWPAGSDARSLEYLRRNEAALALWRKGTECADALERPVSELNIESTLPDVQDHRHFVRLALLHAAKCHADGDLEAAWGWLRAVLRGSRLVGRNGIAIARMVGSAEYAQGADLTKTWMADPRLGPALLRRALNDIGEINVLTLPDSNAMKVEYLSLMNTLDDTVALREFFLDDPWSLGSIDRTAWYNHLPGAQRARWFLTNEPERSRRLIRLAFQNWLSHCDGPAETRPALVGPPDLVRPPRDGPRSSPWFYDGHPEAALGARALAVRVESTAIVKALLPAHWAFQKVADRDRSRRADLVMALAEEVFRREQGREPETHHELIGTVLERVPDGYTPTE